MAGTLDRKAVDSSENDGNQSPEKMPPDEAPRRDRVKQLLLGLLFGVIFGFLLQKGGVAKYHVLIGQLLLTDFTVLKIMMSAVVVGAVGVHLMHSKGLVDLHVKPTRLLSNSLGGLLFGIGFGLAAYCPGTGAAAIGQGDFDALAMALGMLGGSYLFALASGPIARRIDPVGDFGELTFHRWIPAPKWVTAVAAATLIAILLIGLEWVV